jgi:hypothetical protein
MQAVSAFADQKPVGMPPLNLRVTCEDLPFRVVIVRTEEQLRAACEVRSEAYGRHIPSFKEQFAEPDELDRQQGTLVFLAEDKETGQAIGSARLRTNARDPLQIEQCITLPDAMSQQHIAEITRYCARPDYKKGQPSVAIMKAIYLWCIATQVRHIIIGAREKMAQHYEFIGFRDLFEKNQMIPLSYTGGLEHRVLSFEVLTAERNWHQQNHLLYAYMATTVHPDIQIFASVSSGWSRPRLLDGGRASQAASAQPVRAARA